ncbi:MAG TPA: DUF2946 family protein [Pusillimonas sp.]|uniref:DUF2946 family protein n=1 Tax=unclassified Pusillimonas TaxID=2640016 RepID=UPI002602708D|nr:MULTISPECIES: DUF2946 family protein [unclassified Pusillimonas]HLU20252.1 DUF2946 family protein [Pusillimonas sp.]
MDHSVKAALARWPDVPAVFGWLSLSEQGKWRFHPDGNGWDIEAACAPSTPEPGEPIHNEQILEFINRNYSGDPQGRWFFQNGPQRVYVRLDAAPFILHLDTPSLTLYTHNGLAVGQIREWWIDEHGRLFAQTEHGPGMIAGRDAAVVFEALHGEDGTPLIEKIEDAAFDASNVNISTLLAGGDFAGMKVRLVRPGTDKTDDSSAAAVYYCTAQNLEACLGFTRIPAP